MRVKKSNTSSSIVLIVHGRYSQKISRIFEAVAYQWDVQRSIYSGATAAVTREITMAEKTNRGTHKANLTKGTVALRHYMAEQDKMVSKHNLTNLRYCLRYLKRRMTHTGRLCNV